MRHSTRRFPARVRFRTLLAAAATAALLAPLAAGSASAGATVSVEAAVAKGKPIEHNVPFSTRWTADIHGTVTSVGNSILTCDPRKPKLDSAAPSCLHAREQAPPTLNERPGRNNDYWMQYINIDGPGHKGPHGDPIYSSSSADFTLPPGAEVKFARLYWGGTYGIVIPAQHVNEQKKLSDVDQVYFRTPQSGGYVDVTSDTAIGFDGTDPEHSYGTSADVTALVRAGGTGTYEVADMDAALGPHAWGGWSIVVGYQDCTKPLRHLHVWDGYEHQAMNSGKTVQVALKGLHTPSSGTVGLRLGQITYDGDRGWKDRVEVVPNKGTPFAMGDTQSPADDVQNSVLSNDDPNDSNYNWSRNPDYLNTLGYENNRFLMDGKLRNGTTSLTIDYPSTGEGTNIGAVYAVLDLAP